MSVYMIQDAERSHIKIGKATCPWRRLIGLQTAHWSKLSIMRLFEGYAAEERRLHCLFSANHIRGEWFNFHPGMLDDVGLTEVRIAKIDLSQRSMSVPEGYEKAAFRQAVKLWNEMTDTDREQVSVYDLYRPTGSKSDRRKVSAAPTRRTE